MKQPVKRKRRVTLSSQPNDVWERIFWRWVGKGADRSYAIWMADRAANRAEKRALKGGCDAPPQ